MIISTLGWILIAFLLVCFVAWAFAKTAKRADEQALKIFKEWIENKEENK